MNRKARWFGVGVVGASALLALNVNVRAADSVRILADWFGQVDQGGYWQAQVDELGKAKDLKITVLQGGPRIQTIPQVGAGQAEFGIAPADDVLLARAKGAPIRAVFAHLDAVPYTLVYHPSSSVKSPADLNGRSFAVNIGRGYWEWVKKRYSLDKAKEIPVSGDLTLFKQNENMVQQGYWMYLPYRMDKVNIPNAQFRIADLGYRPYLTLFTTDELIEKKPTVVRDTMEAVKLGWQRFVADPKAVIAHTTGLNPQLDKDIQVHAATQIVENAVVKDPSKIGCMTAGRWDELADQLRDLKLLPADFDHRKAVSVDLVPGCN